MFHKVCCLGVFRVTLNWLCETEIPVSLTSGLNNSGLSLNLLYSTGCSVTWGEKSEGVWKALQGNTFFFPGAEDKSMTSSRSLGTSALMRKSLNSMDGNSHLDIQQGPIQKAGLPNSELEPKLRVAKL